MADDDDYMTMTFEDDYASATSTSKKRKPVETSLQRRIRLEREGRERGRVLSKAEQAKAAERGREAALSRSLFDAVPTPPGGSLAAAAAAAAPKPVNKGFAMMAKMGFVAGQALGKKRDPAIAMEGQGGGAPGPSRDDDDKDRPLTEPIRIQVKRDRAGIGAAEETKAASSSGSGSGSKPAVEVDPYAYRDRIRREREEARLERQIHAAQVVAERLANGDDDDGLPDKDKDKDKDERPLSDVNVLWRGMVKQRRDKERERALLIKSQKLLDSRLRGLGGDSTVKETPTEAVLTEDSDDEADDRAAKGTASRDSYLKTGLSNVVVDEDGDGDGDGDGDDDDGKTGDTGDNELAEFDALPAQERLQQVVDWMRLNRRYCFWCKHKYPSDDLDGCPGPTEADHD